MVMLYLFLVGSLALRPKSFRQIDLWGRRKEIRDWVGRDRFMVASDATLWRVRPDMDRDPVREPLPQAYTLLRQKGHGKITLPGCRTIRAAAEGEGQGQDREVLDHRAHLDREALRRAFRLRRVALAYLVDCWILSLRTAAGAFPVWG